LALPKTAFLINKIADINALCERRLTDEDINAKIERKNALRRKFDPQERERVEEELQKAKSKGNQKLTESLQERLDELQSARLAFRTSLAPQQPSTPSGNGISQQDRLAQLNRENRRKNTEAVRKAQIREKAQARFEEDALARGEVIKGDLSRRLKTKAKFVHDINDKGADGKSGANGSGTSTPANGTPSLGPQKHSSLTPHLLRLQQEKHAESKGIPTIHKPLLDDDIIGSLDLDIDVEI
jgi:RNA polymerase-associated protein RTF1